jgi:ketosteroid isomerase-like protein
MSNRSGCVSHQRTRARIWPLVVAALTLCAFAAAQDRPDFLEFKILKLESEWNTAYKRSDVSAMNSLLADDFIITEEDGSTFSKPGYIAHNGNSSMHVEISDMSNLKVRMHGNIAVVTGAYHEKGTEKGNGYEYYDRFTDVWMNSNGAWQIIVSHYSPRTGE